MSTATPNSELIAYQFKTMKESLEEHKEDTNKRFDSQDKQLSEIKAIIKEGFAKLPETYATKKEHEENKVIIKQMQDAQSKLGWTIVATLIGVIVGGFTWLIDLVVEKTGIK